MGCKESNSSSSSKNNNKGSLGAIQTIVNLLKSALSMNTPLATVPTAQILAGAQYREGLSSIDIASKMEPIKLGAAVKICNPPIA